jgi:hypothetical protein
MPPWYCVLVNPDGTTLVALEIKPNKQKDLPCVLSVSDVVSHGDEYREYGTSNLASDRGLWFGFTVNKLQNGWANNIALELGVEDE